MGEQHAGVPPAAAAVSAGTRLCPRVIREEGRFLPISFPQSRPASSSASSLLLWPLKGGALLGAWRLRGGAWYWGRALGGAGPRGFIWVKEVRCATDLLPNLVERVFGP